MADDATTDAGEEGKGERSGTSRFGCFSVSHFHIVCRSLYGNSSRRARLPRTNIEFERILMGACIILAARRQATGSASGKNTSTLTDGYDVSMCNSSRINDRGARHERFPYGSLLSRASEKIRYIRKLFFGKTTQHIDLQFDTYLTYLTYLFLYISIIYIYYIYIYYI